MSFATPFQIMGAKMKADAMAGAARYNAAIAQQNASTAMQQGEAVVQSEQRSAARKMGAAIAAYGASGVQVDSGSPVDVLADSARLAELDKLTTRYNYALRAVGFQNQATLDLSEAQNDTTAGVLSMLSAAAGGYADYQSKSDSSKSPYYPGIQIPNLGSNS